MHRPVTPPADRSRTLARRFQSVRSLTEQLAAPLAPEDQVIQSMPDVSPTKWHMAHVSWFFETFVLKVFLPGWSPYHADFEYLFNSYYDAVGVPYSRARRGLLSRPTVRETLDYRARVDEGVLELLQRPDVPQDAAERIELGLHHEQQHQELLLMDIKHVLSCNPLFPAYRERATWPRSAAPPTLTWVPFDEGLRRIGAEDGGFAYDNERPAHRQFVEAFRLSSRLVNNGEYREFLEDGAYHRPELWLADGWARAREESWNAPLYWVQRDDGWCEYSLAGLRALDPAAPVAHVSYYEAAAYAAWADARLPTEAEWEIVAREQPRTGNFLDEGLLHPRAPRHGGEGVRQMYGDLWEWTASPYHPYPGFRAAPGALGEYNGKFMCNQFVLRGGACVTPGDHVRPTYRNFFYPHSRWQFAGIRLARDGA